MKRFILYLVRWQLSTPILWLVTAALVGFWGTVVANLIGGCIFFWIDRFIFTSAAVELWQLKKGRCDGCGKKAELWRLALTPGYDKRQDKQPKFYCMDCSKKKTEELRKKGIKVRGRTK